MLRKDVQIGLSIGGVLLLVLIVYGAVASHNKHHPSAVVLDKPSKTAEPAGGTGGSDIPPPVKTEEKSVEPGTSSHTPASSNDPTPPVAVTPTPTGDGDSGATSNDKKQTNWAAILLADKPEEVARSETPPLAATGSRLTGDTATPSDHNSVPAIAGGNTTTPPISSTPSVTPPVSPAVEPTPPSTQPASGARTHTIQKGETFSSISKAVYGNARYYAKIAAANPTVNANRLRPGTVINLPDIASAKSSEPSSSAQDTPKPASNDAATPANGTVDSMHYRIARGDSLYKISVHLYGSAEEVDHLYDLNKTEIGADRAKLKLGMILKLPAPPTATASR